MERASAYQRRSLIQRLYPRAKTDLEIFLLLYIPLLVITLAFIVPLLTIIPEAGKADYKGILSNVYYLEFDKYSVNRFITVNRLPGELRITINGFDFGVIGNSIINAAIVTIIAAVLGSTLALLIGIYRFRGRRVFAALAYIPLLIAPFVNAYIVKVVFAPSLSPQGNTLSFIINSLFEPLIGKKLIIAFDKQAGIALAQILMFYPIVYINTLAALGAVDATLIEQALNLGARGLRLVRRIVFPLIVPGILAGSTLVFILSLEDVGAPLVFNYEKMISYQVYQFFQSAGVGDKATIAALSLILLTAAAIPLVFIRRYLSLRYYARLARGAPRPFQGIRLGRLGYLVAYLVFLPIIIAAATPQIGVILLSLSKRWTGPLPDILPIGKLFTNYQAIITDPGLQRAITNSLSYLGEAIVFVALLGFATGYAIARARLPGAGLLDILASLPLAVPGLVVAFSYFVFFSTYSLGGFFDPLINPGHVLVLAYIIRKMPFTVRSVFTAVIQTPEELEEAARSLGARRAKVIQRIVLPLVWHGIIAGLLLSSIYILSEVSVSVTIGALKGGPIANPSTHAAPITYAIAEIFTLPSVTGGTQPQARAAAMASLLMITEIAVIAIASRLTRRGQALITL
ncbi:iron ABC transporter permease [Pyrofollis japonicus]|uniref:ABC transporter permease n=1 Tax=Pyrofollis japonicus TaxID=3060460 RepID=UPI00295AB24A|nr:iron ABC transporter permease [Pyrofollis japonicus]BEP18275.1 iron ABC transporter permease [Pyrofollis japonicus]